MIRNFVTGIVVGGVVAAGGLAVVSQLAPGPKGAAMVAGVEAEAAKAPDAVKTDAGGDAAPAAAAATDATQPEAKVEPAQPAEAEVSLDASKPAEAANPLPATVPAVTAPDAAAPEANVPDAAIPDAPAETAPDAAAPAATAPDAATPDAAVATAPDAAVPSAPTPEAAVPAANAPALTDEAPALAAPAEPAPAPDVLAQSDAAPAVSPPAALNDNAGADAAPAADVPPAAPAEPNETLLNPAPAGDTGAAAADVTLDPAPDAAAPAPAEPAALPKILDTSKPTVLAPSSGLEKTVDGVTIGRLPSIAAPAKPAATDAAQPAVAVANDSPLAKYAASFSNDAAKPLFSVLLVDSGAADLDRAALAALPFAVSFVIDPLDPSAAAAQKIYRDAGKEVVMLGSGIPQGAQASDLEQTFQANAAVLDQSVAVMDVGAGGFQDNRPLATLVVPVIKDQGRGLVTYDKGLNAADQVARRDAVPSALIFRDLDAAGEDTPLIRRYLDRAAFKAAQDGKVVVVGITRPETVAALMEWTVEGRGASVAMAPISAVLAAK